MSLIIWWLHELRRRFGLGPMQGVVRELRRRGVRMEELDALEVFGGMGFIHTRDYADLVSTLDVWEYSPEYEKALRWNLPSANIKITDSLNEVRRTTRKHGMIVVDNTPYCHRGHWKHFDLLPDILRIAMDEAILVLNVFPEVSARVRNKYPLSASKAHLASRRSFYGTDHPEKIPLDELGSAYINLMNANGFSVVFHFFQRKATIYPFYHIVLKIKKRISNDREVVG